MVEGNHTANSYSQIFGELPVLRSLLCGVGVSVGPQAESMRTHQRALDDGQATHGASVHFVTPELDGGPVIKQGRIHIGPEDTADSLAARIFAEVECRLYPEVVGWLTSGRLQLRHGRPELDGEPLQAPLLEDYDAAS